MIHTAVVTLGIMMARIAVETPIALVMETDVGAMIALATVVKEVTEIVMTTIVAGVIAGRMSRIKM